MDRRPRHRAYLQTEEAYQQAIHEMQEKLGEDRSLFLRVEELHSVLRSREEDWVYRQAFCDCMYLLRYMDAFSLPDSITE